MGLDDDVMPHIDMANIACGFHAGDADVIARTLTLAKQHGVTIGAHPSTLTYKALAGAVWRCRTVKLLIPCAANGGVGWHGA